MKKLIFTMGALMISIGVFAKAISASNVPAVVKESFTKNYPGAEVLKWETTQDADYKVEYRLGNTLGAVYYDATGKFIESDKTVEWKEVPLTGRMEVYHSGANRILNALKIVNAKNEVFYQVDLKKGLKKYEILLDQEGNVIR